MQRQALALLLALVLAAACGGTAPTLTPIPSLVLGPQGGGMVIMVMIREDAARALQRLAPSTSESQTLLDTARGLGVTLKPVHPGSQDPALVGVFRVEVPDLATAERVITRLRQLPVVESAYVKPADQLP